MTWIKTAWFDLATWYWNTKMAFLGFFGYRPKGIFTDGKLFPYQAGFVLLSKEMRWIIVRDYERFLKEIAQDDYYQVSLDDKLYSKSQKKWIQGEQLIQDIIASVKTNDLEMPDVLIHCSDLSTSSRLRSLWRKLSDELTWSYRRFL